MSTFENLDKNMIKGAKEACQKNANLTARMLSRTAPRRSGKLRNSFAARMLNKSWYVTAAKHWVFSEKGTGMRRTKKGANRGKLRGIHYAEKVIKKLNATYQNNISKITK